MGKTEEEPHPLFDVSVELTKIHVFSEHVHERLATSISNIYAFFVGFLVLFFTLFYSNILPLVSFILAVLVFLAGTIYESLHIRRQYQKSIVTISQLIEQVKEKKELPRLQDLIHQR